MPHQLSRIPCSASVEALAQEAFHESPREHEKNQHPLMYFNAQIQKDALSVPLNEKYLENKLREFLAAPGFSAAISSLTLTRLNEMALVCAGNYADNCEYAAAGDLMVNPRQVMVYLRDQTHPVLKDRHAKLTTQFIQTIRLNDSELCHASPAQWWIKNTIVEIRKKPLLTQLHEMMIDSDIVSTSYIASAEKRMKQIADTMGFLSAWKVGSAEEFYQKLATTGPSTVAFIQKALCRFDLRLFNEMGEDIRRLLDDSHHGSRFLDRKDNRS